MNSIFKNIIVRIITWQAQKMLARYKPNIIAITGTVGKTSTKDTIYAVIKNFYRARKSEKSFNSEIGVPLTILGLPNAWRNPAKWLFNIFRGFFLIAFAEKYPQWLVLEVGADKPGDIASITEWLKPDVTVITKFAKVPVHVEFFESPAQVIFEKSHLVKALKKNGTLILNADDADVFNVRELFVGKVATFGIERNASARGSNYTVIYDENAMAKGIAFHVSINGSSIPVKIEGILGKQLLYPALAAFAVANMLGIHTLNAAEAITNNEFPRGRMNLIPGIKGSVIIDDTYNSSPIALDEALNALKETMAKRKIAVLADMLELGGFSDDEHEKAGLKATKCADLLFTLGKKARIIGSGAEDGGMDSRKIFMFDSHKELSQALQNAIQSGDLILIKGSQGMRMEKIVEEVMSNPENKKKLLVRQDKEWQRRRYKEEADSL